MPSIVEEIPGFEENISRPVAIQVIRDLMLNTGIPPDTEVRYVGNGGSLPLPNSTIDKFKSPNRLPGDANIDISVSESFDESRTLTTAISHMEYHPEFTDNELGVYIKPYKNRVTYVVDVKYTSTDKTAAQTWYNGVKRKFSQGVNEYIHKVDYHYPVPLNFIFTLGEIFKLKETSTENAGAWLRRCFSRKMSVITNLAGKQATFVIKESQFRIRGYFDFDTNPPLPEKENNTGVWSISFSYTFDYDRCDGMVMDYPLMIHNQFLPCELMPRYDNLGVMNVIDNPNLVESLLREFDPAANTDNKVINTPGLSIPLFDDWISPFVATDMANILRVMIQVDTSNPRSILNLKNLGEWKFDDTTIAYMKETPINMVKPYESVFNIGLFNKLSIMDSSNIIVTSNLDVLFNDPLDTKGYHHLTLNLVTKLSALTTNALVTLCIHGYFTVYYLITLYPWIAELASDTITLPDGTVIVIGDPTGRPSSLIVNGVRVTTIIMPDGTVIQSTILPYIRSDGTMGLQQLIDAIKRITNRAPFFSGDLKSQWRLVGNFVLNVKGDE